MTSITTPDTHDEIALALKTIARRWNSSMQMILQLRHWSNSAPGNPDQLLAVGFSSDEVDLLKAAINKMGQAVDVTLGVVVKNDTEDLTVFPSRVWGLSITRFFD